MIELPTCPFDQVTAALVLQPLAVRFTDSPKHTVVAAAVMAGACGLPTVIVQVRDALVSHVPNLQIALYVVVAEGFTAMLAPVIPFDHKTFPSHPTAVSLTLSPVQMLFELAVIVGTLSFVTLTVTGFEAVLVHKSFTLHVAVNVLVALMATLMLLPV